MNELSYSTWRSLLHENSAGYLRMGGAVEFLKNQGYDVVWAGDWDEDPGDEDILLRANLEGRILVTLDKDFGEIAIVRGIPHCGIVRLVNLPARQQGRVCGQVIQLHAKDLQSGAIVTVEPGRVRSDRPTKWIDM